MVVDGIITGGRLSLLSALLSIRSVLRRQKATITVCAQIRVDLQRDLAG